MRIATWVLVATLIVQPGWIGLASPQDRQTPKPSPSTDSIPIVNDGMQNVHGHKPETNTGTPPCGYRNTSCGQNPSPPTAHNDDHTGRNVAIGVGVGALAGVLLAKMLTNRPDHLQTLSQKGPQFPELLHMSRFQVTGFLRGTWPMILDYEAEAGSYTVLTISSEGAGPFKTQIPTQSVGRQRIRMRAPASLGADLKIADFTIVSTKSKTNPQLSYFRVYGFGAGPRAVGSVAIDQLKFGPPTVITAAHPDAKVGFHAHTAFDKVTAEFMQLQFFDNCLENKKFDDMPWKSRVLENNNVEDNWNGRKSQPGQIQFRVRGWMTKDNGGDWVSAFSPQLLQRQ
jgi:hypothetical protein